MNAKGKFIFFWLLIGSFCSCSLIFQTIRIEVPKGYVGWVYVIPIKDTSGLDIQKQSGRYKINKDGVVYVPTYDLNIKKDSRVFVYEQSKDISNDKRYAGSVYRVMEDGKKYEYIHFYLPSFKERKIANHTLYWRDSSYKYKIKKYRLDSLLNTGRIVFK